MKHLGLFYINLFFKFK